MARRITTDAGRAALAAVAAATGATGADLPRAETATAVRYLLQLLVEKAPGGTVEVRVPPYGAVQVIEGPRHTRGTPPNVVETDAVTWIDLATGARVGGCRGIRTHPRVGHPGRSLRPAAPPALIAPPRPPWAASGGTMGA
jgi:hypothetical protein